jgi:uncharacterized membrane protein YphA (DoxX/SURF4 family)
VLTKKFRDYADQVFQLDLRSLILFRIYIGVLAIYDGLIKFSEVRWLYSKDAYVRFIAYEKNPDFWFHQIIIQLDTNSWQIAIALQIIAGCFIIMGRYTKLFLVIWLVVLRLTMRRNQEASHIGDLIFSFYCYAILFLPLVSQAKTNFLDINTKIKGLCTWPYFAQACALYFFAGSTKLFDIAWRDGSYFVMLAQRDTIWERFPHLIDHTTLLTILSYALPYLQIIFGVIILVKPFNYLLRLVYFLFWLIFHFVGYLTVPDATMIFFLMATFMPILPTEYWDHLRSFFRRSAYSRPSEILPPSGKLKSTLACTLVFFVLSSNLVALSNSDSKAAHKYMQFLSNNFIYQYWRIFSTIRSVHNTHEFYLKKKSDSDLELLPPNERPHSLIAGRFQVMKRGITVPGGIPQWVTSLCLDLRLQQGVKEIYSITVKTLEYTVTKQPPYGPFTKIIDETEYVCDKLPWDNMQYPDKNKLVKKND